MGASNRGSDTDRDGCIVSGSVCDVCERTDQEVVGVASSSLGPMSFAWCRECLQHCAEPKWMLEFVRDQDNWRVHLAGFWEHYEYFENGSYHPAIELKDSTKGSLSS